MGLFDEFMQEQMFGHSNDRDARLRKQAIADEQMQYDLNKQRASALLGEQQAQGRQDYMPLLRQLPTTAAAALGPMLTSQDPRIQAMGQQQLQEYQRRGSPETQQQMAGNQLVQTNAATDQSQKNALFPGQLAGQQMAAQEHALRMQLTQQQIEAGQMAMEAAQVAGQNVNQQNALAYEAETGNQVPSNYQAKRGGNGFYLQPVVGSEPYQKDQLAVRDSEDAARLIGDYADLANTVGTEQWGVNAGKARTMHRLLMGKLAAMNKAGALGDQELMFYTGAIPDITEITPWQTDAEVQGALTKFEDELNNTAYNMQRSKPWIKAGYRIPGKRGKRQ